MPAKTLLAQFTRRHLFLAAVALSLGYTACDSNPTETAQNDPASASPTVSSDTTAATSPAQSAVITSPMPGAVELTLNPANGFTGITEIANAKLTPSSEGLKIRATTVDPMLALPPVKAEGQSKWIVHVKISSPATTTLQIFYDTRKEPGYAEARSIRKALEKGDNDVVAEFENASFGGKIRLDPGELAGDYLLTLVEVRPAGP